eukprot:198652-Prorocentrum_lima.AAC.1
MDRTALPDGVLLLPPPCQAHVPCHDTGQPWGRKACNPPGPVMAPNHQLVAPGLDPEVRKQPSGHAAL